jgi:hypothetical protein
MSEGALIDLPNARALLRLRYAVEHAAWLARDQSEPGVHIAVIALDGAVEFALWIVARAYAAPLGETATRPNLLKAVHAILDPGIGEDGWRPPGESSVDQLHRARNNTQHAAVPVDPSAVPDWSSAARSFIESLVETAFERPLSEVSLADAVRDEGLADLLHRAHERVEGPEPDPIAAFVLICRAFDDARRRWREQQAHIYGRPVLEATHRTTLPAFGMLDPVVPQDERLADLLDVTPFANDLGEYSWFLASRRQQQEAGWSPDSADCRRALAFVSGWIVRWEVFDRGYPVEAWEKHRASLVPPVIGDGEGTTFIGGEAFMIAELPGGPAHCDVLVSLANIPDRAPGGWRSRLLQSLHDAATELEESIRFDGVQMFPTGQLLLQCPLGCEADAVSRVVRRGIEITDARYRQWSEDESARRAERQKLRVELTAVIDSVRTGRRLFDTVEVTERAVDGKEVVTLGLNFGDFRYEELNLCLDLFRSVPLFMPTDVVQSDRLTFEAFDITDENATVVRDTIHRCEDIVFERRKLHAHQRLTFQKFAGRIAELFSAQT